MRRLAILSILLVAAVAGALLLTRGGGDDDYRVDAVFDTASAIVPGQNVKIAGAKVGRVEDVKLLRTARGGYKARIRMRVEGRFAPFRPDATCRILPEGLISENFVECVPGRRPGALPEGADGRPTVALARTTVPLSLQDVLDTFEAPTDQSLRLVLNSLGIATAGRGEDINALLRRANPALTQAGSVLGTIADQRRSVARAVGETDQVLADLSTGREHIRGFVANAASAATATASRSDQLSESIRRMPAMLTALHRSLGPVQRAAAAASPALDDLRAAAPRLSRTTRSLPRFANRALPAFRSLDRAGAQGLRALPPTRKVVGSLRRFARDARPTADLLGPLMTSFRNTGGSENLVGFFYGMAIIVSLYDDVSHYAAAYARLSPRCIVANMQPGTKVERGCSHAFTAPGKGRIPAPTGPVGDDTSSGEQLRTVQTVLDYILK